MLKGTYEIWVTNWLSGEERRDNRKFWLPEQAIEVAEAIATEDNKVFVMTDNPNDQTPVWGSIYGRVI